MESSEEVYSGKTRIITEEEFREKLIETLPIYSGFKAVTGPGRSGAIAAVYASHLLNIPYIIPKFIPPKELTPVLIVDTAMMTGRTLRKMSNYYNQHMIRNVYVWMFSEPPRVKFWYEEI